MELLGKENIEGFPDTWHECEKCMKGEIVAVFNSSFEIELLQFFKFSIEYEGKEKICDCYWSFDFNDFGLTTCPHKTYRITLKVVEQDGGAVPFAQVECDHTYTMSNNRVVESETNTFTTDEKGILPVYLKNGEYSIMAEQDGILALRTITVNGKPMTKKLTLGSFENLGTQVIEMQVGDDVYYKSYDNGIAVLEGTGSTWDYTRPGNYLYGTLAWEGKLGTEKILIVTNGITHIGRALFAGHRNFRKSIYDRFRNLFRNGCVCVLLCFRVY